MIGNRIRIALVTGVAAMASLGASLPSSATDDGASRIALPRAVADYRFGNSLQSSTGTAPDLTDVGPKVNEFGVEVVDGMRRAVYQFPRFNGVELSPASSVISRGHYTIAVLMRFDKVDSYRRIINFAKGAEDEGLYVEDGVLYLYDSAYGAEAVIDPGEWVQVVLTRAKNGEVKGYVDGELQFTVDDRTDRYAFINPNDALWFFRDDSNREESSGAVARIRLFANPLSEAQVAGLAEHKPTPQIMAESFTASPGDTFTVDVANFGPFETVRIVFRDPVRGWWRLGGEGTVDQAGNGSIEVSVRRNATLGEGRIKARGETSGLKRGKAVAFVGPADQ